MSNSELSYIEILQSVMGLSRAGFNKELLPFVDRAIGLCQDLPQGYIVKGAILEKEDAFEEAEAMYRQALEKDPRNPQAMQALGMLLVDLERFQEAVPLLLDHLSIEPQSNLSLEGFLTCLSNFPIEHREKIETYFNKAWQSTNRPEIGIQYAHYLMLQNGDTQTAKTILEGIREDSPSAEGLAELALAYSIENDCEKAIDSLKQAIELNPKYDRLWRGLAQCYTQIEDYQQALQAADEALKIDPDHYRNLQAKAETLIAINSPNALRNALALIERAKEYCRIDSLSDPDAKPVLQRLFILEVESLARLGEDQKAIKVLQQAVQDFPKNIDFVLHLFVLYYETGQNLKAWQVLSKKEFAEQKFSEIIASIGADFFHQGKVDIALDIYQKLIDELADPEVVMNYAYMLGSAGKIIEAIQNLEEILHQENLKEEIRAITQANLAYLHFCNQNYVQSTISTQEIFQSSVRETTAILHIPFWYNQERWADPINIPGRNITILKATQACYIAAALAKGENSLVTPFVPVVQAWEDQLPEKYLILAEIYQSQGRTELVIQTLNKALEVSQNAKEQNMINEWIEILKRTD